MGAARRQSVADAFARSGPLLFWNDGATKKAITDFVARLTMQSSDWTAVATKQDWNVASPDKP